MNVNIKELISKMTLEEKASLCSGEGFMDTKSVDRLNIPSIIVSYGPTGVVNHGMSNASPFSRVPATCFPTSSAAAASWDTALVETLGKAIGEEC